jgi:CubicO group peptidase (beta-lactamase class C family)
MFWSADGSSGFIFHPVNTKRSNSSGDSRPVFRQQGCASTMKIVTKLILCLALTVLASTARAGDAKPFSFPRSTPEAQGVSSAAVLVLVEALDQVDAMNSFMLVRHGHVVAEGWWTPYDAQSKHELYSLSKSFTSTAVGMAVAEGKLSIDDEVLKFFPEDAPANPSGNLKAMRVRDLLTMNTGNQDEIPTAADKVSAKAFLTNAVPHKPGTHFKYNTPATFVCSAIVQKLTGQTVAEYLKPRLFEPLGITQPVWNTNWQGINLGGYGLNVRTEDIARFGQLYLQKGKWNGRQLISLDWVAMATSKQVSNGSNPKSDWDQGYGFQFWRCRNGAYRGDGAFGQYCIVLPEQDAVIAITSGVKDMQAVLNLIWDKLLPAFGSKRLKADAANQNKLVARLGSLVVHPAEGAESSALKSKVFGRKFVFPANEQKLETITLTPNTGSKGVTVAIQSGGTTKQFTTGYREWQKGRSSFGSYTNEPAAATSAWVADDTLVIKQCFTETPYYVTRKLRFDGDQVLYDAEANVGFRNTKQAQLTGLAE